MSLVSWMKNLGKVQSGSKQESARPQTAQEWKALYEKSSQYWNWHECHYALEQWLALCYAAEEFDDISTRIKHLKHGVPESTLWSLLNLKRFQLATTSKEAKKWYDEVTHVPHCDQAFPRMEEMIRREAEVAINVATLRALYEAAPWNGTARDFVIQRWTKLSGQQIEAATTTIEAQAVWENVPPNSPLELVASKKWLSLCVTIGQAQAAYSFSKRGSEERRAAIEKLRELGMKVPAAVG